MEPSESLFVGDWEVLPDRHLLLRSEGSARAVLSAYFVVRGCRIGVSQRERLKERMRDG